MVVGDLCGKFVSSDEGGIDTGSANAVNWGFGVDEKDDRTQEGLAYRRAVSIPSPAVALILLAALRGMT